MREIEAVKLAVDAVDLWMNRWLLLTAGTLKDCNMMTVGWGGLGCMWSRPFAQVVVRPQRHTRRYMDSSPSFTLCGFPGPYREDLLTLGTLSGRDGDKLSRTGLSLKPSREVSAPSYHEADLILECRKTYFQDMDAGNFLDPSIQAHYPENDFHRIYFGEILAVFLAD